MVRLGVVTTSYPREAGDPAGHFVAGFARWLVEAGADVEVIAAGPGQARIDGIPVTRVEGGGLFYAGGAPDALARPEPEAAPRATLVRATSWARAASFQVALTVAVARRVARWDGVVTHWLAPSSLAVEGVLSARRNGYAATGRAAPKLRHLAIAHSSDVWLLRRSKAGRALLRAVSARADLVYAARHLVVEDAPGRVVPMGIDAAPRADRATACRRWATSGSIADSSTGAGRTCALFIGRLVEVKGLDLLLAALPANMDLIVAGEGPLRARWAAAARGDRRVRFVGEVRGEDKALLFAATDVLVVPSRALADGRSEGTPTVLMEALAAGLPLVATRTGGAADILTDGENALLIEPEVAAIAAALERIASDVDLRRSLGGAALRSAPAHFWSAVGPRLAGRLLDGLTLPHASGAGAQTA